MSECLRHSFNLDFFVKMKEIEIRHFYFLHLNIQIIISFPILKLFGSYQLTNFWNELSFHSKSIVVNYHFDIYFALRIQFF